MVSRSETAVTAVILAGGYGRRMGEDKALLPWGAGTTLDQVAEICRAVAESVWVVRRPDQQSVQGVQVTHDLHPGDGPLAGLESALSVSRTDWTLVVPIDAPRLQAGLLRRLANHACAAPPGTQAVVPLFEGKHHPLCAVYHASAREVVTEQLENGQRRVMDALQRLSVVYVEQAAWIDTDPQGLSFRMMNTPEEYRAALSAWEKG